MAYAVPGQLRPQPGIDFAVISEAFSYLTAHWKVYCIAGAIILFAAVPSQIVSIFPTLVMFEYIDSAPFDEITGLWLQYALLIPSFVLATYMEVGITKYTLNVRKGEPYSTNDLWEGFKDPLGNIWAGFLANVIALLGLIACCLGIYVTSGLMMFVFPAKVDQRISGSDAVSESWNMLKGEWIMAALLFIVVALISGLGYIACIIGAAFTMPFMYIVQTLLYCNYKGYFPQQTYAPSHSPYPRAGQPGYGVPTQPGGAGGPVPPTDTTERPSPRPDDPLAQPPND